MSNELMLPNGTSVIVPERDPISIKAATGIGSIKLQYEPQLDSFRNSPQQMMARFLKAYRVGWFYKAESAIAFDVSTTEVTLKREDGTEVERPDRKLDFDALNPIDQCARLLDMPNPQTSWRKFIEKTQIRTDMAGNAFWYMDEQEDVYKTPSALWNISPARMWPSAKGNKIIGWIMDYNGYGNGTPFKADEILHFSYGSADDDVFGVGVVEAVLHEWQVGLLLTQHINDVLTLGGRLAGMISPKEKSLTEDEFNDTVRAWRAMANGGDAGRRLLVFPEPVEWTRGSATPQEIGLPSLNDMNRTNILSAFPINEFRLGVPVEAGLNSGDTRKHMFREHYEFTVGPRIAILKETIQKGLIDKFSDKAGEELTIEFNERNRDDAPSMLEKAAAFRALLNLGFDPESIIPMVGLDMIKWDPELLENMIMQAFLGATEATGQEGAATPAPGLGAGSHSNRQSLSATGGTKDPAKQARNNAGNTKGVKGVRIPNPLLGGDVGQRIFVNDSSRKDNVTVSQQLTNQRKASSSGPGKAQLPKIQKNAKRVLEGFFKEQRERIISNVRQTWPATKAARKDYEDEAWWNGLAEDIELREAIRDFLEGSAVLGLQEVANELDRILLDDQVSASINGALELGESDITGINETTKKAIGELLQEGAKRGYSINQIIDGFPADNFGGLQDLLMANGEAVFGDWRAETIARTELGKAYNRGNLLGYRAAGIENVEARDGDFDDACRDRDGKPFSIDQALMVFDHPNGTLDWLPLVSTGV